MSWCTVQTSDGYLDWVILVIYSADWKFTSRHTSHLNCIKLLRDKIHPTDLGNLENWKCKLKYLKFMESYIFPPDNRRSVRGSRRRFTRAGSWEWWEGWVISAMNCAAIGIRLISIFGQDPPVRKDFSRTVNMKVEFILVIIKYWPLPSHVKIFRPYIQRNNWEIEWILRLTLNIFPEMQIVSWEFMWRKLSAVSL